MILTLKKTYFNPIRKKKDSNIENEMRRLNNAKIEKKTRKKYR